MSRHHMHGRNATCTAETAETQKSRGNTAVDCIIPLSTASILVSGLVPPPRGGGGGAGHTALHTCASWCAYAAMFGSSKDATRDTSLLIVLRRRRHSLLACFIDISCSRLHLESCTAPADLPHITTIFLKKKRNS